MQNENNENEEKKIVRTRRGARTSNKARIACLMAYREERGINPREKRNDDDDKKKKSLAYEMNVITKRYQNQQFKK